MRKILYILIVILFPVILIAQDPNGNYNPYVSGGIISPSPLLPLELNGTGTASFNVGNTGSDPLDVYPSHYITLTITLSYGDANTVDPLSALSGSSATLFSWIYNAGTYTGTQISPIPASSSGSINIAYKVTQNSVSSGLNGFNVNLTPAPYQTDSNSPGDDAVSSYTYTEINDFGDAPASYGSAYHSMDFENYLGSLVDGENSDLASAAADGDDLDVADDEEGVVFPAQIHREEIINIPVTIKGLGRLNAWIDWNGDGDFSDVGEQIASNVSRMDGTQDLSVTVPSDAIISTYTFARFRFSPGTLSSSSGPATGGEVEDYQINILCAPPTPSLTFSDLDSTFCAGTSIIFTAGGGTNYDFRVNGSSVQSGTSNSYITSSITDGQIVDVIVTDAIGCSANSDGIESTVNPLPIPTISSSDTDNEFCEGVSILFSASGGTNYNFRVDGSSVQNESSNTYTSSSLSNGQLLDVIVTDLNGCSANSATITNTVNALPIATLTSSDADSVFCAGTSITFSAIGGTNYNFRIDGSSVQDGALVDFTSSTISDGQVVDVIVANANGCVDTSSTITNTVNPLPIANAGAALSDICQGETSVALGGSVGGSATSGIWSTLAGGTFTPDANTLNASWIPPAAYSGSAILTLTTVGGTCGTITDSKTQVVNPTPTIIITDPTAVCSPATVDITDAGITVGSTSGLTYTYWTDISGTLSYSTPATASDGTYYIRGSVAATGCSDIQAVTVGVIPTPSTPVVIVSDNCNATSSLSTSATGSLLWSTGETSSAITVNTAGVYTVNTTENGCTSADGSGTTSPLTEPNAPTVSNAAPENVCPEQSIDLSGLITSSTPTGGSILYKTSNDPLGTDVSDPTAVAGGSYYIFYEGQEGCFSPGIEVIVSISSCPPDLTPTLIVNPNIMHGITSFDLTVKITELNIVNTNGAIIVNIPKDSRWFLPDGYVPSLTIIGATSLNNNEWTYSEDAINHIFSSITIIPSGGFSTFGFRVTFDPGSTRGFYSITSQIVGGSGGETRGTNNADSESIDYFQE